MLKPLVAFAILFAVLAASDHLLTGWEAADRADRVRVGRLIRKEEREGRPVAALRLESAAMPAQLYAASGGGLWRCITYHNAVASEEKVQSVVKKLFEAEGVIQSEDATRGRDYGLDMPTTLRLSLHGANMMKEASRDLICAVEIGNPTHEQEGCYLRRAPAKEIWVVDSNPRPELDLAPGQTLPPLLDPNVIPSAWWKNAKQMKLIKIERAGEEAYELEMRERQLTPEEMREMRGPPDPSKPMKPRFEWYLKKSGGEQLTDARLSSAYTSFLVRTPYREVLDPARRAQLGLDRPRAKITITTAQGEPLELSFGGDARAPVIENRAVQSIYGVEAAVPDLLCPRGEQLVDPRAGNPWEPWLKRQQQGQ